MDVPNQHRKIIVKINFRPEGKTNEKNGCFNLMVAIGLSTNWSALVLLYLFIYNYCYYFWRGGGINVQGDNKREKNRLMICTRPKNWFSYIFHHCCYQYNQTVERTVWSKLV